MKRRVRAAFGCIALMVPLVVGVAQLPAAANDIQPFDTEFSTDFVSAGFGGIRGIGTGSLTLAGVSGPVTRALLYWHGPTNSTDPTANASVTFGGTPVTGTQIGFSDNNCWGFTNSQAYRADVTSLVAGDGSYSLANFTKPNAEINGVSLLVFFDDGNPANNRDIVLFDGNDSNIANAFDANGWNTTLSGINYSSGTANLQLYVSDGQSFADDALLLNGMTLAPAGPVFQGNTVPNGAAATNTSGGPVGHPRLRRDAVPRPGPEHPEPHDGRQRRLPVADRGGVRPSGGRGPGHGCLRPTEPAAAGRDLRRSWPGHDRHRR